MRSARSDFLSSRSGNELQRLLLMRRSPRLLLLPIPALSFIRTVEQKSGNKGYGLGTKKNRSKKNVQWREKEAGVKGEGKKDRFCSFDQLA